MANNNVVHITPPSLYLKTEGTGILFLGFDEEIRDTFQSVFEKYLYNTEVQFYYIQDNSSSEENLAWKFHTSRDMNFIIVNIDECDPEDLVISLMTERDFQETINLVFVSFDEKSVLSAIIKKYTGKVITSFEDFDEVIKFILEEDE